MKSLLLSNQYPITDHLVVRIPTLREILILGESQYFSVVNVFTSTPYDCMVELDDLGIDYESICDFELFCLLLPSLQKMDTSLIFPGVDFSKFQKAKNEENSSIVLWDGLGSVIDDVVYWQIAQALRKINFTTRNYHRMGNQAAKRYFLDRERKRKKRAKQKSQSSILESEIIALVNSPESKYDFSSVLDLNIYQFNASVRQIQKRLHYHHLMTGVYSGTVDLKSTDKKDLSWIAFDS